MIAKEPRLDDLLNDPLIHQVMERDGVMPADLAALVRRTLPLIRRPSSGNGQTPGAGLRLDPGAPR